MGLEEIQSVLHALRQLYGLLQNIGHGLQNTSSENLDEKARLLLKNLLDNATQSVFETHSKITAAQSGVSNTTCSSQPEQPKAVLFPDMSKAFPSITRNSGKEFTLQKDERPPKKPTPQEAVSELSKLSISSNKPEYRKKQCRVCEHTSIKRQNSAKDTKISNNKGGNEQPKESFRAIELVRCNENPTQKRICEIQRNSSTITSVACSSSNVKKMDEMSDFSKDVANEIERIESRISALQCCSQIRDSAKTSSSVGGQHGLPLENSFLVNSISPLVQTKEEVVTWRDSILGARVESLSQPASQNEFVSSPTRDYVHGLRVPLDPSRHFKENPLENHTATRIETTGKVVRSRPSMPPRPMRSTSSFGPPRQIVIKPTLLDHASVQRGTHKTNRVDRHHRDVVSQRQYDDESEDASSNSRFVSSSWTSQQSGASSSIGESISGAMGPTSRRIASMALESSLDESSSTSSHYREEMGPTRRYRSSHRKKSEKTIGQLKRLKNKLGLIFHHHHHHHHHHHDHSQMGHKDSKWKPLQRIFPVHQVHDAAVQNQKVRKSTVGIVPHKNQVGHFHTLVEGLLSHTRHSKKSKPLKSGIGRLGNGPHVRNKKVVMKKLHWWKMFRRNHGVKLTKQGRFRVGKKAQLKMR